MSSTIATFRSCSCTEGGRRCPTIQPSVEALGPQSWVLRRGSSSGRQRVSPGRTGADPALQSRPRCSSEESDLVRKASAPKYRWRILARSPLQRKNLARSSQWSAYATNTAAQQLYVFWLPTIMKSRPGGRRAVFCIPHTMEAEVAPVVREGKVRKFRKRWVFNPLENTLETQSKKHREVSEHERVQKASD